eukprot:jgi/Chrzof1/1872/Cz10g24130.t1
MPADTEDSTYPAVVSGPCWSIPLTSNELTDFLDVLQRLQSVVQNLSDSGQWLPGNAERPVSRVKWEGKNISMKATYAPAEPGYSIDLAFKTDYRSVHTNWPAEVVDAVSSALERATGKPKATATAKQPTMSAA